MVEKANLNYATKIQELESRLEEAEQLIDTIKRGEVDAFAISRNNKSEIYTLETGDYAYRVLIEQFAEGAINVTEEGLIVYTNEYFCKLLNLSYEKVIGSSIFEFIHVDSAQEFHRLFKESLTGKSKGEIFLSDGVKIPVYISLTSLQPKLATVGIIITDLTNKKKNEQIILEYQKDLESKNIELIQRNADLASFAYIASHDLQEPLRKIQTFSARVLEKEYDNLSEKGKDHFRRMQVAAKRMQTLIEDLLVYSRTNLVDRKFVLTDLNEIIEDVKADLKEELTQKNAVIETHVTGLVSIIPFQFRQLLSNLINNSLKFSMPDQPPLININGEFTHGIDFRGEVISAEKIYYHISVTDNGIGFEQQYSEKIFDLFQRLHGKHDYQGTGIGLAIVKKIVENHNGIITAEGAVNKGATFNIYIPVQ